jgi:molybdate transport system regulatory protein
MKVKGNFWVEKDNKSFLGKGRIELLKKIDKYGSISKAAKEMKMSYKAAWDAVDIINNLSNKKVVEKVSGGKGGGGTKLTEYGKNLIKVYENAKKLHDAKLLEIEEYIKNALIC